jgi:hypothetical protein
MEIEQFDSGRIRAYLLIKSVNPMSVAAKIYKDWGEIGGDEYVVNRADVVYGEFNVVVPVDAISEDKLREVEKDISGIRDVKSITIAKVSHHYPALTYMAHGFVSEQEGNFAKEKKLPLPDEAPGRRRKKSPGDNPWG